jgi:subtilase family serine protease
MEQKTMIILAAFSIIIIGALAYAAFAFGAFGPSTGQYAPPPNTILQKPDLIVSNINTTTCHTNSPMRINATIANIGNAATGKGFNVSFNIAGYSIDYTALGPLAAGSTITTQITKTFTSNGTYGVNVTADSSNIIAESNEMNNVNSTTFICS